MKKVYLFNRWDKTFLHVFTQSWKHSSRILGQIDKLHRHFVGAVSGVEGNIFLVEEDNLSSAGSVFAICDERSNRGFFLLGFYFIKVNL